MKDSVIIDFDNKRIECSLPLRGKIEDFLSNNRDTALATVIQSFYKLFDGNFAVRFDELDDNLKKLILSKTIQHYLHWCVVYKDSLSSPCQTEFDDPSKTPCIEDGKGGRFSNDLTMKGKINTLDLLNLILRFRLGVW